ncbi:ABC transporter permease, partial [Lysobacter lacus]
MWRVALRMLAADRAKFAGLVFGLAFTSFLVTFAASFFCGFMTHGYGLVSEHPQVDVWVMDPAVEAVEQTTNLPPSALARVRGVPGVRDA